MLKGLSRLWWRGVKQIGKAQKRQNKNLMKSLLALPAKPPKPRAATKIAVAKKAAFIKKAVVAKKSFAAKKNPPRIRTMPDRLAGRWLSSYYNSYTDDATLPARRMQYWLYLPQRETTSGLPLLVMLHGCDQTAVEFAQGSRMNRLAEEKGFAVLYPQQSLKSHPQRCWPWYELAVQEGGGEVGMIAGCIDKVLQQHGLDMSRVYVAGLSAGAAVAHILALTFPNGFAAVGLHSGPVFGAGHSRMGAYAVMQGGSVQAGNHAMEKFAGLPVMPAILLQGGADKVVRPVNQMQLADQFRTLNHLGPESAVPVVRKAGGNGNACEIRDFRVGRRLLLRVCEIDGLGHAWSGGDAGFNTMKAMGRMPAG